MNLFFVINSLSNKGGTERVAILLANLFSKFWGFNIYIFSRDRIDAKPAYELCDNIKWNKVDVNAFEFRNHLQSFISKEKPSYVIFHNMGRLSLIMSTLLKGNARFISLEHVSFLSRKWYLKILIRFLYHKFDNLVCLTESDAISYPVNKNKIKVIPNISPYEGINNKYDISSKKIIAIGRLTEQKNFKALIAAWSRIQKDISQEWSLEIWGDGELKAELEKFIKDNNVKSLYLKGTSSNMSEIYRSSSFLVMSSLYEGLPMVLVEAISFGLPIVSFDCPCGPKEIIANDNGILVENGDIDALASAIKKLILDPELRASYSINAKIASEKYTSGSILDKWRKLLEI